VGHWLEIGFDAGTDGEHFEYEHILESKLDQSAEGQNSNIALFQTCHERTGNSWMIGIVHKDHSQSTYERTRATMTIIHIVLFKISSSLDESGVSKVRKFDLLCDLVHESVRGTSQIPPLISNIDL
jgi:hypothetical protein